MIQTELNQPEVKDLDHYPISELYQLVRDVYLTSEGMSESVEEKYPTLETFEQDMIDLKERPGAVAIIAEVQKKPLGYLLIKPRHPYKLRHTADLNMGVKPSARGKRLGRLLLHEALTRAKNSPRLEIIYLMVRADNMRALKLYQKAGFERLAVLDRDTKIDESYYDGILMRMFV